MRYPVQPVGRGNATHQSHRQRDVCRAEIKRAMTICGGVSVTHVRSDRGTAHRRSDGASQCILSVCRVAADLKRLEQEATLTHALRKSSEFLPKKKTNNAEKSRRGIFAKTQC